MSFYFKFVINFPNISN